jgi:hypothetical protein
MMNQTMSQVAWNTRVKTCCLTVHGLNRIVCADSYSASVGAAIVPRKIQAEEFDLAEHEIGPSPCCHLG